MLIAHAGDVGFTAGKGILSSIIRHSTQARGEGETVVNHTLLFTRGGYVVPDPHVIPSTHPALAVEALWKVEHHSWWHAHHHEAGTRIYVFRPAFLDEEAKRRVIQRALQHVGERYGWWKLLFHLGDHQAAQWGWEAPGEKKLSSLLRVDKRPICSYLVGRSFEEEGYPEAFGSKVPPQAQDPDDQWDYAIADWEAGGGHWRFVGSAEVPVTA